MTTDAPIRVLHVDDDTTVVDTVREFLAAGGDGVEVVAERDAEAALERIRSGDRVDCVVSDYDMPGTDGLEFLSAVRETHPDLPFIVFTGEGSETVARDALRAGATDYLRKRGGADKFAVLANRIGDAIEKRRAERRLSELEDRYRDLFETAPVPVAVHSDGEIREVNRAAVDLVGAEGAGELVGRDVMGFVHPDDRETAREHIAETLAEGRSDPIEERLVDFDGNVRYVEVAAARTTVDGGRGVQMIARDVTERRERERELERERDRFSALFENVPDPAVEVHFEDGEPVVVGANPAFESVFGYDRGAVEGESVDELIVPPDRGAEAESYNERIRAGESLRAEVRRETADGPRDFLLSIVPRQLGGDTTGGFAIYTDVTERERRERTLRALNEASRDLMDAETTEGVANRTVDAASEVLGLPFSGVFTFDGEAALRLTALSAEAREQFDDVEPLRAGESVAWEVFESGEPVLASDIREHPKTANPDTDVRSELIVPLGEYGVLVAGSTEVDEFGDTDRQLASVLAANVEAALRRARRETDLREQRRTVERQNERLEEFASVVSHDLRNPLEQARGYLELARAGGTPDPEDLDRVDEALGRIDEIISDVLTLARQGGEVEETEPVDLELVAMETDQLVDGGFDLELADPPGVVANEGGLRQLLENLFRNVADHADGAETVRVGAVDGGFFVEDDGHGIPAEERPTVFESGYSTGEEGTGFGLTIVREVAEAHGWSVDLVEGAEGGARFEVTGVETA
jgi:PAS domain S-box-containing protein